MSDATHDLVHFLLTASQLPVEETQRLALRGAIAFLEEAGTPEAIDGLAEVARSGISSEAASQALEALRRLSRSGTGEAIDKVFELAIQYNHPDAQAAVVVDHLPAPEPGTQIVFWLLTGQAKECLRLDPTHRVLTAKFTGAPPDLQARLLQAAQKAGWTGWYALASALVEDTPARYADLLQVFGALAPDEQDAVLDIVYETARRGSAPAKEALCELYLVWDSTKALELAEGAGYAPEEPVRRALFFFLAGQWDAYERLDFSHTLIGTAYENAALPLRRRILSKSRYAGRTEWLQPASEGKPRRWLKDLNDADWDYTLAQLNERMAWDELWRLALFAPPVWGVQILDKLQQVNWQPENPDELDLWQRLGHLSAACRTKAPEIYLQKTLHSPEQSLTALAVSPDGRVMATGCAGQVIQRWQMPRGDRLEPPLIGPVAQTRAMVFSPDGKYLVAASGDQAIRIYRTADGKLVKTLSGHTGTVRGLAIHPDGRTLFSASFDGQVRAWRFPLGPDSQVVFESAGELFALAIAPEGELLITGGANGVLQTIHCPTMQKAHNLAGHKDSVTCLCLSASGQLAASYGRDQTLRLWNPIGGRELRQMVVPGAALTGMCFDPAEQVLMGGGMDGRITFWNTSTGSELLRIERQSKPIIGLALQQSEAVLVTAMADGEILCWGIEAFLLARRPVELSSPTQIQQLEIDLARPNQTTAIRNWLAYLLELMRWKGRYNIQIGETRPIHLGEFDIEL